MLKNHVVQAVPCELPAPSVQVAASKFPDVCQVSLSQRQPELGPHDCNVLQWIYMRALAQLALLVSDLLRTHQCVSVTCCACGLQTLIGSLTQAHGVKCIPHALALHEQ